MFRFMCVLGWMSLPLSCGGLLSKQPSLDNVYWDIRLCSIELNSKWPSKCSFPVAALAVIRGF